MIGAIRKFIQKLASDKASAPDLQQAEPARSPPMFFNMADGRGCKDGDAGAVNRQLLSELAYPLKRSLDDAIKAAEFLKRPESVAFIEQASELIAACYRNKRKVLIAGNGGSLCDAMHFAEELTGQFRGKRPALAAIALSDPSHMSCVANDMGFDEVFSRGVEALGCEGDVFVALTTSGNSPNIVRAVYAAKQKGLSTVSFLGKAGGALKGHSDLEWIVSGFPYSDRVQEAHMAAIHVILELVEQELFA
jgi:D-sedoheptulose 7-phosphate isomerase